VLVRGNRRGLVVVVALAAMLGAWLLRADEPPYETSADLVVGLEAGDGDGFGSQPSGALARTYAGLVESRSSLDEAARALGLPPDDLSAEVEATADEVTRLVIITVRDDDAEDAADLANALADVLVRMTSNPETHAYASVSVLTRAPVPTARPERDDVHTYVPAILVAGAIAAGSVLLINGKGRRNPA
jgi:capsular polysaccharide biosynthesis protein